MEKRKPFFIVGHYYRWVGPKTKSKKFPWNPDGYMDPILDGKPRRCIRVGEKDVSGDWFREAMFEGLEPPVDNQGSLYTKTWTWNWTVNCENLFKDFTKENIEKNIKLIESL